VAVGGATQWLKSAARIKPRIVGGNVMIPAALQRLHK